MEVTEFKKELLIIRKSIDNIIKSIESLTELTPPVEDTKRSEDLAFMESVIEIWNEGVGAKCTLNETVKRNLRARLKNKYSKEQILEAVMSRIAYVNGSGFHNEPSNRHHKVNIGLVLRNDQELEKYLNSYSQQELFEIKEITIGMEKDSDSSILD